MPTNHINQYRKQIGTYNAKPHKLTDKAFRKAVRKAQNSHARIDTHHSSTFLKIVLVAGVVSATITSTEAMLNGQRNNVPGTKSTFPLMGTTEGIFGGGGGTCSAWKINRNQLVTAKHCVNYYHPWGYIRGSIWSWDYATHRIDYPDKRIDLSILRFDNYDLAGFTYCVPMMSKNTYQILKESPDDICGSKGRFIVAGRGRSEEARKLFTGKFDFFNGEDKRRKTTKIRGTLHQNKRPAAQRGDSGGAVLGCNPLTGEYEYVGLISAGKLTGMMQNKFATFTNVALFPELGNWISQHTYPCVSTTGYKLKPNDLYRGDHTLDKCKLPAKYYEKAGMNNTEICKCYNRAAKHTPPRYPCQTNPALT